MGHLVLVRGLPGIGKSTFAKSLKGYQHFETDKHFTDRFGDYVFDKTKLAEYHKKTQIDTYLHLEYGNNVVVSNTFSQKWEMQPYINISHIYGDAKITIISLRAFSSIRDENIIEKLTARCVHHVPIEVIKHMNARWEDYESELVYYVDISSNNSITNTN